MASAIPSVINGLESIASEAVNEIPVIGERLGEALGATTTTEGTAIHAGSQNASTTTSHPCEVATLPNATDGSADDFLSCAYEIGTQAGNIEKMVWLGAWEWKVSHPQHQMLGGDCTPQSFYRSSNHPLHGQVGYFGYVRTGYHFRMTVNAPPGCQGAIVLSWAPGTVARLFPDLPNGGFMSNLDPGTLFNLPYAILNVGTSTEVSLLVPYVHDYNYCNIVNYPRYDKKFGFVFAWVLGGLQGASINTVNVNIYGALLDCDLQAPRPWTNEGRRKLRRKPIRTTIEPPEERGILIRPGPGSWNAANSCLNNIAESAALVNEGTYVDYSTAGANAAESDLIDVLRRWSVVGIVTWQGSFEHGAEIFEYPVEFVGGNFKGIMDKFHFWRGSLEFKVYWMPSKFTTGHYQMSWYRTRSSYSYAEARNSVFITADVNGPAPKLVIPFTNDCWRAETKDHYGMLKIFVVNPLLVNSIAQSGVQGILFMRAGSDFQLMAPAYGTYAFKNYGTDQQLEDDTDPVCFINYEIEHIPIHTKSHTILNALFGRPWYILTSTHEDWKERYAQLGAPRHGHAGLMRYYAFWTGELVLTFVNNSGKHLYFSHSYDPRHNDHIDEGIHGPGPLFSNGAIHVPPRSAKNVAIPYYAKAPLRQLSATDCFGTLYWFGNGEVDIFAHLRNSSFFFKVPTSELDISVPGPDGGEAYVSRYIHQVHSGKSDVVDLGEDQLKPIHDLTTLQGLLSMCKNDEEKKWVRHYWSMYQPYEKPQVVPTHPGWTCGNRKFRIIDDAATVEKVDGNWQYRAHSAQEELVKEGIEPNPGPVLVYKDRGLYRHYGVRVGPLVYHVNTENIFKTILSGKVNVMQVNHTDDWVEVGEYTHTMAEHYLKSGALPEFKFSCDENCESWAREMMGDTTPHQGNLLVYRLTMAVALGFFTSTVLMDSQNGFGDAVQALLAKISNMIFGGLENEIVRVTIRFVIRIICYLILYIHSPNILTTGVLAALLALDATDVKLDKGVKELCKALVEGDFHAFCELFVEGLSQNDPELDPNYIKQNIPKFRNEGALPMQNEAGPKPFNEWTTCAKNVQWWVESLLKVVEWIKQKIFPPGMDKEMEWLKENEDHLATALALADEHICLINTDKAYYVQPQTKKKHQALCDMISGTIMRIGQNPKVNALVHRCQVILNKLQSISFEPSCDWHHRPEPLGIWISGTAGVGKSFLSSIIVKRVAEHFGWKAYSNPTGSNHMDGYTNQQIHLFDDFGQQREEEDYGLICNLISSVPFIVPKADVSAKGTMYNGRLVVVTTNRHDFSSTKLYDAGALSRRFPIKLKIKPAEDCAKNGRLDVSTAMRLGKLKNGACWVRNLAAEKDVHCTERWQRLDVEVLIREIIEELEMRMTMTEMFEGGAMENQGPEDEPAVLNLQDLSADIFAPLKDDKDLDFDFQRFEQQAKLFLKKPPPTKMQRFKAWIQKAVDGLKNFLEKNRAWIIGIGALGTIISLSSLVFPKLKEKAQAWYAGEPVGVQRLTKNFKLKAQQHVEQMENQGHVDLRHICNRMVILRRPDGAECTGLALGKKQVLTYSHDKFDTLVQVRDRVVNVPAETVQNVLIDNKEMDLAIYDFPKLDIQFKDVNHLLYFDDYFGDGFLLWKDRDAYYIQEVKNIHPFGQIKTIQGNTSTHTYLYNATTTPGSCGGLLVGIVGGNARILGIHTSGNSVTGGANRLFPIFKPFENQGVASVLCSQEDPFYFQPRRTKLKPSPLFVYDGHNLEPAVLSNKDKRLEIEVEDITKKAAAKYCSDVFRPPPDAFQAAIAKLSTDFSKVLGMNTTMTFEQAKNTEFLPIDWNTSPGMKYPGKTKKELLEDPEFEKDVQKVLNGGDVYFATYLKDELRPIEKVKQGNTRAIEASNFDYVMAFRRVMGTTYKKIYDDRLCLTGIAVGMNVFTDFDTMIDSLYPHCLCLDFSKFDGSLSDEVMSAAVEVFGMFHDDPQMVENMHDRTIFSLNYVGNELWYVRGGMCSGSPCTTVLNSAVNLLCAYTVFISLGAKPEDIRCVAYGDDLVVSLREVIDLADLQKYYKLFFGMTVTTENKDTNFKYVDPMHVSFLKRTPKEFPGTQKVIGVLNLNSMLEKIQWMRSRDSFEQQLDSFFQELSLHGKEQYEATIEKLRARQPTLNYPPWKAVIQRMKVVCLY